MPDRANSEMPRRIHAQSRIAALAFAINHLEFERMIPDRFSNADDDLAEVGAALHVAERLDGLFEREDAIDDRPEPVEADGAVHVLEHRARADVDALDADALHQHGHRVDLAAAGEDADQGDVSPHAHGL